MKKITFLPLLAVLLSFSSCYYDVEEELYPEIDCDTQGVTYSGTIQPLLSENCLVCHSAAVNTAGITLEGYDKLNAYPEVVARMMLKDNPLWQMDAGYFGKIRKF